MEYIGLTQYQILDGLTVNKIIMKKIGLFILLFITLSNAYGQKKQKVMPVDLRVSKIKSAQIGDLICYSQFWTHTEMKNGFFFTKSYEVKTDFEMYVMCYIEKKTGNKFQVRISSIESNNSEKYTTPTYKEIPLYVGDIIWIDPIKDKNWLICE